MCAPSSRRAGALEAAEANVGLGWTGINLGPLSTPTSYDLWLTGLEIPVGRLRPYVELQCLGPVASAATGVIVQAYAGITMAVR